jgi:hypothetical protein
MVLDAAFGSGVKVPLTDVGEACEITGAGGAVSCVEANATPGDTTSIPMTNAREVEKRRAGVRRPRLTATSLSRMCPHVLSRYVLIGLHVDFIDCKTAPRELHASSKWQRPRPKQKA